MSLRNQLEGLNGLGLGKLSAQPYSSTPYGPIGFNVDLYIKNLFLTERFGLRTGEGDEVDVIWYLGFSL